MMMMMCKIKNNFLFILFSLSVIKLQEREKMLLYSDLKLHRHTFLDV
jgi:hypothetical protein